MKRGSSPTTMRSSREGRLRWLWIPTPMRIPSRTPLRSRGFGNPAACSSHGVRTARNGWTQCTGPQLRMSRPSAGSWPRASLGHLPRQVGHGIHEMLHGQATLGVHPAHYRRHLQHLRGLKSGGTRAGSMMTIHGKGFLNSERPSLPCPTLFSVCPLAGCLGSRRQPGRTAAFIPMWSQMCGMAAKAAVLLMGLSGTQRQIRLTATMVLLDAALLPPQFRNVEGQPDAKSPKGMYGKPGTRRRPKPAPTATFDGWTLLGIVAFTHILDAGALLLALTERARRLPLETHAPEQALASILRAPPQ